MKLLKILYKYLFHSIASTQSERRMNGIVGIHLFGCSFSVSCFSYQFLCTIFFGCFSGVFFGIYVKRCFRFFFEFLCVSMSIKRDFNAFQKKKNSYHMWNRQQKSSNEREFNWYHPCYSIEIFSQNYQHKIWCTLCGSKRRWTVFCFFWWVNWNWCRAKRVHEPDNIAASLTYIIMMVFDCWHDYSMTNNFTTPSSGYSHWCIWDMDGVRVYACSTEKVKTFSEFIIIK